MPSKAILAISLALLGAAGIAAASALDIQRTAYSAPPPAAADALPAISSPG